MSNDLIIDKNNYSHIPILTHLYVWSVILHPLLFFYVAHEELIGIGGNIAKFLELIVSICILKLFILNNFKIRIPPKIYSIYWVFVTYSIIVGLIGYFFEYYKLNYDLSHLNQGLFSMSSIRPLIEYVISIFYFFYFVILGFHFLSETKVLDYFFKVFFFFFYVNLILGLIDVISTVYFQIDLVPISLIRDTSTNYRFHGISGEPRDAFVFLIFGLSMFYLFDANRLQKKRRPFIFFFSIIALVLTATVSGLIGLIIAAILFMIYSIIMFKSKNVLVAITVCIFISLFIFLNISLFERFDKYIEAIPFLFNSLNSGNSYEGIFIGQLPNIWPLFSRFQEVSELNLLPTLFGTGIGSVSALNVNMIEGADMVLNPHAQAIRLFYSVGIIGSLIYLMSFIYPVYKTSKIFNSKVFIFFTILLLGVTLGHRSVVLFIFLGVFSAVFNQTLKK